MAEAIRISVLLAFLGAFMVSKSESSSSSSVSPSSNFIQSSCSKTQFPAVCVNSLSIYASRIQRSPSQLAQTALAVSVERARSANAFVSRLAKFKGLKRREHEAISDCITEMEETVDRLRKSAAELRRPGKGQELAWHISNAETWVSAALTDENTCLDGFGGKGLNGKIKDSVRARVVNVAQVTSNALALVTHFGPQL